MILIRLLLLGLLLGACNSPVDPDAVALEVHTQASEFVISPGEESVSVFFTITNRGATTAFLARCGERIMAALDRREGGIWVQYSADACLASVTMAPLEITPGQSLHGTREIRETGEYRLRIGVSADASDQQAWTPTSSSFTVR